MAVQGGGVVSKQDGGVAQLVQALQAKRAYNQQRAQDSWNVFRDLVQQQYSGNFAAAFQDPANESLVKQFLRYAVGNRPGGKSVDEVYANLQQMEMTPDQIRQQGLLAFLKGAIDYETVETPIQETIGPDAGTGAGGGGTAQTPADKAKRYPTAFTGEPPVEGTGTPMAKVQQVQKPGEDGKPVTTTTMTAEVPLSDLETVLPSITQSRGEGSEAAARPVDRSSLNWTFAPGAFSLGTKRTTPHGEPPEPQTPMVPQTNPAYQTSAQGPVSRAGGAPAPATEVTRQAPGSPIRVEPFRTRSEAIQAAAQAAGTSYEQRVAVAERAAAMNINWGKMPKVEFARQMAPLGLDQEELFAIFDRLSPLGVPTAQGGENWFAVGEEAPSSSSSSSPTLQAQRAALTSRAHPTPTTAAAFTSVAPSLPSSPPSPSGEASELGIGYERFTSNAFTAEGAQSLAQARITPEDIDEIAKKLNVGNRTTAAGMAALTKPPGERTGPEQNAGAQVARTIRWKLTADAQKILANSQGKIGGVDPERIVKLMNEAQEGYGDVEDNPFLVSFFFPPEVERKRQLTLQERQFSEAQYQFDTTMKYNAARLALDWETLNLQEKLALMEAEMKAKADAAGIDPALFEKVLPLVFDTINKNVKSTDPMKRQTEINALLESDPLLKTWYNGLLSMGASMIGGTVVPEETTVLRSNRWFQGTFVGNLLDSLAQARRSETIVRPNVGFGTEASRVSGGELQPYDEKTQAERAKARATLGLK